MGLNLGLPWLVKYHNDTAATVAYPELKIHSPAYIFAWQTPARFSSNFRVPFGVPSQTSFYTVLDGVDMTEQVIFETIQEDTGVHRRM